MTDEPKPTAFTKTPPALPEAVEIADPFDVASMPPVVPVEDEIPTIPVATVRRRVPAPEELPEALPTAEGLPSRRPTALRPFVPPPQPKPAIDLEPPQPKVFLSLFIMFLMAVAASVALTVLFYSIYVGFQTLKPNRKKAAAAPFVRLAPAITKA